MEDSRSAIGFEFETLARRSGIEVPPDLLGGVLAGYGGLRQMASLLRAARADGRAADAGEGIEKGDPDV